MASKRKKRPGNRRQVQSKPESNLQPPALPTLSLSSQSTTTDASQTQNRDNRIQCRLLQIPLEVRRHIYGFLLEAKYVGGSKAVAYTARVEAGMTRLKAMTPWAPLSTVILRVNKQIHEESSAVLWSSNQFVKMTIYSNDSDGAPDLLEHSQIAFTSTDPTRLAAVTRHALDVEICENRSRTKRCLVMFPAALLPRLMAFLGPICDSLPLWGRDHTFSLTVRNLYSDAPQKVEGALLEPWRCLHGLADVKVDTQLVAPAYAKSLREDMIGSGFEPWKWLKSVTDHKESGAKFLKEGKLDDACAASAIVGSIMINTFHQPDQARLLRTMPPQFHQAVNRLRFQSELNITLAIIRSKTSWKAGLEAANAAIDLAEDEPNAWMWARSRAPPPFQPPNDASWYNDTERAKARFRRASIMMALGEHGYACGDLSLAQRLSPSDTAIQNLFCEAKKRYDPKVRPGAALERTGIHG